MSAIGVPLIGVVGPGRWAPGSPSSRSRPATRSSSTTSTRRRIAQAATGSRDGLTRRAARPSTDAGADRRLGRRRRIGRLRETDVLEQLGDEADVVIEAALEYLDLKRTIFRTLDAGADPTTILATNTSALSVAAIAAATTRPGARPRPPLLQSRRRSCASSRSSPAARRIRRSSIGADGARRRAGAGPPSAPPTPRASSSTASTGRSRSRRCGSSRRARPAMEEIDAAMRDAGFPLGPFELMDLTGIDVTIAAATAIWEGLGRPDRLRPSPIQEELVAAGRSRPEDGRGVLPLRGRSSAAPVARSRRRPDAADAPTGSRSATRILGRDRHGGARWRSRRAWPRGPTSISRCAWARATPQGPFERAARSVSGAG